LQEGGVRETGKIETQFMAEHSTVPEALVVISLVEKRINSTNPTDVAHAIGVSVASFYGWKSKGMPLRRLTKLKEKFGLKKLEFPSGRMIRPKPEIKDPKKRIWVSVNCAKCRHTYEICCSTFQSHGLSESPMCYFNFGIFICPDCRKTCCI